MSDSAPVVAHRRASVVARSVSSVVAVLAVSALAGAQPPSAPAPDLFSGDALRVLLCGTANPLPAPGRAKSCTAVIAGGKVWLVDVGEGSWTNLSAFRVPGQHVAGVLLTHFHSDHISSLGDVNMNTWALGRPGPLPVYGPEGVERVVNGFAAAYELDTSYRVAHHGAELFDPERAAMEPRTIRFEGAADGDDDPIPRMVEVLRDGDLLVRAFLVDHEPIRPAVGYRFDYGDRSVVISGDTAKHPPLAKAAAGADILVHEAQANHLIRTLEVGARSAGRERPAKILSDIPGYHTTPVEAAELANEAGVGLLVLSHLGPAPRNDAMADLFLRGVAEVRSAGVVLGEDGMLFELPRGGDAIETKGLR